MSMKRSDSLSDRIQNSSWLERDRATVATNQRPPSSSTSTTTSRPSSPVPSYTSYSLKIPSSPKRGLSVSSSLFSTRLDPISTSASIPFPSSRSPLSATDINGDDQRVGLTRAQSNLASLQGHKRSMTLPHLTTTLPGTDRYLENVVVPKKEEVVVGESRALIRRARARILTIRLLDIRITGTSKITFDSTYILLCRLAIFSCCFVLVQYTILIAIACISITGILIFTRKISYPSLIQ